MQQQLRGFFCAHIELCRSETTHRPQVFCQANRWIGLISQREKKSLWKGSQREKNNNKLSTKNSAKEKKQVANWTSSATTTMNRVGARANDNGIFGASITRYFDSASAKRLICFKCLLVGKQFESLSRRRRRDDDSVFLVRVQTKFSKFSNVYCWLAETEALIAVAWSPFGFCTLRCFISRHSTMAIDNYF